MSDKKLQELERRTLQFAGAGELEALMRARERAGDFGGAALVGRQLLEGNVNNNSARETVARYNPLLWTGYAYQIHNKDDTLYFSEIGAPIQAIYLRRLLSKYSDVWNNLRSMNLFVTSQGLHIKILEWENSTRRDTLFTIGTGEQHITNLPNTYAFPDLDSDRVLTTRTGEPQTIGTIITPEGKPYTEQPRYICAHPIRIAQKTLLSHFTSTYSLLDMQTGQRREEPSHAQTIFIEDNHITRIDASLPHNAATARHHQRLPQESRIRRQGEQSTNARRPRITAQSPIRRLAHIPARSSNHNTQRPARDRTIAKRRKMSDEKLRALERRWNESGMDEDFIRYHSEMERGGRYDLMAACPRKVTGYLARYDWAQGTANPLAVLIPGQEERIIPTEQSFGHLLDLTYADGALHILHSNAKGVHISCITPEGQMERTTTFDTTIGLRAINGELLTVIGDYLNQILRYHSIELTHRGIITPLNEHEALVVEYDVDEPNLLQIVRFDGTHVRYPIEEHGRPRFAPTAMVENGKVMAGYHHDNPWIFEDGTTSATHVHRPYEIGFPERSRAYRQLVDGRVEPCHQNDLAKIYSRTPAPRALFAEIPKECLEGLVKACGGAR